MFVYFLILFETFAKKTKQNKTKQKKKQILPWKCKTKQQNLYSQKKQSQQ